jgi:hypothetical protein
MSTGEIMHTHPVVLLKPVFDLLDEIIRDYGLYIYMAMVCWSPFLVVWILSGGFWRKPPRQPRTTTAPPFIRRSTSTPPPVPPITRQGNYSVSDDDSQAFAA